jgi:hypothetical protein
VKLPNKLFLSFLCSAICLLLTAPSAIHAQDQRPLYLLTSNVNSRLSSIWEYNLGDAQATRIFTLQPTQQRVSELFSAHELAALRQYPWDYGRSELGSGEDFSPMQNIGAIWQLDPQHVLLQTTNEIQDAWGRSATTAGVGRFGYHEFLILDLKNQQLTSIFTLDYHDPFNDDWQGASNPFIQLTWVEINPTRNQLALMLTSSDRWLTLFGASVLIVDYSTLPATVTHLPHANSPVWSPDGRWLAYWQAYRDYEKDEGVSTSLGLQAFAPSTAESKTAIVYPKLQNGIMLDMFAGKVAWIDDEKLFYSLEMIWLGGGDQTVDEVYDLKAETRNVIALKNPILRQLLTFGRGNQPDYLMARGYDDTAYVYSTDSTFRLLLSLPEMNI